jgi:3-hydroxyisobutyrate dehydrogenase-like beta-hydroxyacid dehydrogenase
MMASFSEGLLLGAKAGLDPKTIIEVKMSHFVFCMPVDDMVLVI